MAEKVQKIIEETVSVRRRTFSGIVVSNRMKDTVVVAVTRYVKDPKYKKYIKHVKRFKAHDPSNTKEIGEKVLIEETRPLSKEKRHRVV
ncbi:MAG TPA: 30S ribosomal protein S17 [Candidatus Paceibacterota bacterium]